MTIEALEGRRYADRPYRVCREKIAEFVDVTGDETERWDKVSPPGFAAALLFVVAPELLDDPLVTGAVIHGDQSFAWHRPVLVESDLLVSGTVDRVRSRGQTAFVTFSLVAADAESPVVEGRSTFLVGGLGAPLEPVEQPGAAERAASVGISGSMPSPRSASRRDLVRYAAATRDWNPIHWDRDTATEAGLGGIVVHGLLQSAWLTQIAATAASTERPLESARFRYTAPLRPGQAAEVRGDMTGSEFDLSLIADGVATVSGRFRVAS